VRAPSSRRRTVVVSGRSGCCRAFAELSSVPGRVRRRPSSAHAGVAHLPHYAPGGGPVLATPSTLLARSLRSAGHRSIAPTPAGVDRSLVPAGKPLPRGRCTLVRYRPGPPAGVIRTSPACSSSLRRASASFTQRPPSASPAAALRRPSLPAPSIAGASPVRASSSCRSQSAGAQMLSADLALSHTTRRHRPRRRRPPISLRPGRQLVHAASSCRPHHSSAPPPVSVRIVPRRRTTLSPPAGSQVRCTLAHSHPHRRRQVLTAVPGSCPVLTALIVLVRSQSRPAGQR